MAEDTFPLTEYQRDIWTLLVLLPPVASYNIVNSVRLRGPVDPSMLNDCLQDLGDRHDALRLRFGTENGVPFQWVTDGLPEIEYLDLSHERDPRAACLERMETAAAQPMDYTDGAGLFRVTLLREDETTHYLFSMSHHLVVDGLSIGLLVGQLLFDYETRLSTGHSAELPDSSYRRFADQRSRYAGSDSWSADLRFFQDRLADHQPVLFEKAAESTGAAPVARHTFELGPDLIDAIRAESPSLYAHFLAALAIYLGRFHRTDDVVLGIPFGNRRTDEERVTAGTLANVLPLRIGLDQRCTLGELARRIHDQIVESKPHERIGLGSLLRNREEFSPSNRQLFDVVVSKLRLPSLASLSDRVDEYRSYPMGHSLNALQIFLREYGPDEITVDIECAPDVFDADQPIEMLGRRLLHLMTMIAQHPERELRRVDLMLPEEKVAVAQCNSTAHPYDATTTLDREFVRQAHRTPDALAVCGSGTLTYGELDTASDALAGVLRSRGIRRGDRVAVVMERRPELLVAIFAALKCGAAYVPVDPGYPRKRVEHILSDCAACAVLACRDLPLVAERPELPFVFVDASLPAAQPAAATANATDLAYVIYTSGSTGRPKGVMVEHHSVINRLAWMQRTYLLSPKDVVLQKTPISFDVSVWELFWWALAGARLALLAPGGEKDPGEMLEAIASHGVTVMHFVPSMLEPFLDLLEREPERLAQTSTLRLVFSSGEALRRGLVDRFNRVFERGGRRAVRLVNLYGPTEATVDVSYHETHADPAVPTLRIPIGRPIDNIELHVLGSADLAQPVGMPGELVIGGAGVASGYLGRPGLTAEKFCADPFRENGRLYRTGDLVRRLADGSLEYLGRMDSQVKIRGNRIELGEVEDALVSFDAVPRLRWSTTRPAARTWWPSTRLITSSPLRSCGRTWPPCFRRS
ncbi:non-ribosomal peptide synthetase [Nocardia sp. CA-128927]|uniref:non-ribosomal peptide synthetase n=1 Tax=Nocardia sp. CA-128927 TaxID=3239975 RepID=UPI003D96B41D